MNINLISGPRNISTALMYSFAQRSDTRVIDEPFYAYYLNKTGIEHPGRAEILASQSTKLQDIFKIFNTDEKSILFLKNMAHHLIMDNMDFLGGWNNLFLIRDPQKLITSFAKVIPKPTLRDIGLKHEWELFEQLRNESGVTPVVMDSGVLLQNPRVILTKLCTALGIPFDSAMLSWPAGPKSEDGIWASYWYSSVHQSTEFTPPKDIEIPFPEHCEELLNESLPYYQKLVKHSITL